MSVVIKSFKILNWKLLLVIFLTLLMPTLYETVRVYFVGEIQSSYPFSIAGNLNWTNVMFEVLEEAFLLPLFFILKRFLNTKQANKKIIGKSYIIFFIYICFITIGVLTTNQLLTFMQAKIINNKVIGFVRVEFVSRLFVMIVKMISIFLIAKKKWKILIYILIIQNLLRAGLDFFIVGNNKFSLKAGIIWIAWNQLIVMVMTSIIGIFMIIKIYKMKVNDFTKAIWFSGPWGWRQNFWSGIESLIRNAFFVIFVIKTINTLPSYYNQGHFWVMNIFIWNWLLMPVLAIAQYVNRDQAFKKDDDNWGQKLIAPAILVTFIIILWFATIPIWELFIKVVLNNKNYQTIADLAVVAIGFYVIFAYNNIIDKFFIGSGKSQLIFWQSLITNAVVYVSYYYSTSINNLQEIVIMFGIGISVDSFITFVMFGWYWYQKKKENFKHSKHCI